MIISRDIVINRNAAPLSRVFRTLQPGIQTQRAYFNFQNVRFRQCFSDQISLPRDILGVSHRIPRKNKNAVYRLEISALIPEIFNFEKQVKYANEMTVDVLHSTQYYLKYTNRAILANLRRRPLKLGRL